MWRIGAGAVSEEWRLRAEITKEFTFEAAHHLPGAGVGHKCSHLHGHLFRVEVTVAGEVDPAFGWIMDFGVLVARGRELMAELDHRVLNDLPGLDCPTSERLAELLYRRFCATVPGVVAITVHESPTSRCTYRPDPRPPCGPHTFVVEGGEDASFCAAHCLLYPPEGREEIHGHDYLVRVAATVSNGADASIEETLRAASRKLVRSLDHRLLMPGQPVIGSIRQEPDRVVLTLPSETLSFPARDVVLMDLSNITAELLAGWMAVRLREELTTALPGLTSLTVGMREGPESWAFVTVGIDER